MGNYRTVIGKTSRAIGGALRRALGSGPGAGAIVLSFLFFLDLAGASIEFMGFSGDRHAYDVILHRYGRRIVLGQLEILGVYAFLGAGFGAVGALIGRLWDRSPDGQAAGARKRMARGALAALGMHGYFLARSIDHHPQLYSEALYDHGGIRRALEVTVTRVPMSALDLVFFTVIVGLIARPLMRAEWQARLTSWFRRRGRPLAAAAVIAVIAIVTSGFHRKTASTKKNLLLIAVDSLRADRVFGDARFPAIQGLAARGVRFREAHVTVPRTFPSFVTLLTGRWPFHHGIRHMFPTAEQRNHVGPALPSALARAGYRTIALSDYAGEIFSRTPLGFTDVDVPYFDMKTIISQRGLQVHPNVMPYATTALGRKMFPAVEALPEHADPDILVARAKRELEKGEPFFMTVFFSTAHFPYAAPAPWYHDFSDPRYDGPFRYQKPPLSTAPVGPDDAKQIRALYDGAVASVDDAIARLLQSVDFDNTTVVLLADHGENLYDFDGRGMGHGDHLRGSAADHVPLIVVSKDLTAHDVNGIVRDVDVAPTLAALLGVEAPPTDGTDLAPLLRGEKDSLDLHAFGETEFWFTQNGPGFMPDERLPYPGITGVTDIAPDDDVYLKPEWQDMVVVAKHRDVRTPEWKLLYRPTRAGVLWSLYDLKNDPNELTDVAAQHADVVETLRAELIGWMTADGKTVMRNGFAVPK